jgi:hypothetical protein
MKILWPLLSLVLLFTGCTAPEKSVSFHEEPDSLPSFQVDVATSEPKLGEIVPVRIRVRGEKRLVLPPLQDLLNPAVEILDEKSTEEENEFWQRDIHLDIALYNVTNVTLFAKSQATTLSDPSQQIDLPFQSLSVTPTLDDDAEVPKLGNLELPDFRGPEALKRRRRNLWISSGVAVLVLIGLLLLTWWLKHRPKAPPPPPVWHRIALKDMARLRQQDIWLSPDVDASAVALSDILRAYIEGRFGIQAPDRTTEEFLQEVQESKPWPESESSGLKHFFTAVDRIKFAGDRPDREILDELMRTAEQFIHSTADTSTEGGAA